MQALVLKNARGSESKYEAAAAVTLALSCLQSLEILSGMFEKDVYVLTTLNDPWLKDRIETIHLPSSSAIPGTLGSLPCYPVGIMSGGTVKLFIHPGNTWIKSNLLVVRVFVKVLLHSSVSLLKDPCGS